MRVRLAEFDDCNDILEWRNDKVSREMSLDGGVVAYSTHKNWFDIKLDDKQCILAIGVEGEDKVGVVRYDLDVDKISVSINLNPKMRGKGLAEKLLTETENLIPNSWRPLKLLAEIKAENSASVKVFERGGYCCVGSHVAQTHKTLVYEKRIQ